MSVQYININYMNILKPYILSMMRVLNRLCTNSILFCEIINKISKVLFYYQ